MVLLIAIVALALVFDYTNGFHDTANAIATSVSTRALSPRVAVVMAAGLNLLGALVSTSVAKTVGEGLVDTALVSMEVVMAALVGAVVWNFATWYFGIPSSSSHALFGGLIGAMIAAAGLDGSSGAASSRRSSSPWSGRRSSVPQRVAAHDGAHVPSPWRPAPTRAAGGERHPGGDPLRHPGVHYAHDHRGHHGRRLHPAPVGGSLGRRRQHRDRMGVTLPAAGLVGAGVYLAGQALRSLF